MDQFKVVYESGDPLGDYLICNLCGERVERGIFNIGRHYETCQKRKIFTFSTSREDIDKAVKFLRSIFIDKSKKK